MTDNSKTAGSNISIDETDNTRIRELLQKESGARMPGGITGKIIIAVALAWALFQLWNASPFSLLSTTMMRPIHLAFAIFLAFMTFPAMKRAAQDRVPWYDWVFALAASASAMYLVVNYEALAVRPGRPLTMDLIFAAVGMVLLLEATRRALGKPLVIVVAVFLIYTYFGPYFPEVIQHSGRSFRRIMSHQWLTTEGVFGVAIGVSASFVFLFVLFGSLLDRAGAGNYFIQVAFSLLGHMRGGPAKAAVVASGATGIISGSSIANVVTTGTFTIPLMKRVGFSGTKAGAVEVASSTNGQLTPPIMGAAAFLMIEYVGISYIEVITHAILPALISYVALIYMVHLEAVKANMKGIPRRQPTTLLRSLISFLTVFIGLSIITLAVYYGIGWIRVLMGPAATPLIMTLVLAAYIGLIWYACRFPDLIMDNPDVEITELPEVGPTVKSGLYYILPVVMLVWFLAVERRSPGLSVFWATMFMIFIVLTQRPLKALFRRSGDVPARLWEGMNDLYHGLINGSRNMIGIGVATAAAGIVVGTVTLTGIGLVMTDFVEFLSGGNLFLMLLFTAVMSLILGMGLPTTANYIVVSTLMAPVIVSLGAQNGLIVPLIAAHLFVFYFGILADDTPPVGLAAYAAAAVSRADPIMTGVQGFAYDIRTAILPFMFIFNTSLLLIDIESIWHLMMVVTTALTAMLIFAAATQGFWLTRTRIWETVALLLIAFTLFRPGFWWDMVHPPLDRYDGANVAEVIEDLPAGHELRMRVSGMTMTGDDYETYMLLPLGEQADTGTERLANLGLANVSQDGSDLVLNTVQFGSVARQKGLDLGWRIEYVELDAERPPAELMWIPALLLLGLIALLQLGRRKREQLTADPAQQGG
ncbi:TRAP transporter fused permease subunit [Natronospirillum operosum]|uniref:TRAP transporter fused permease subunit n=1 Tax=Natronospirillum operosum TaxID=2759953 RepID=A0A4Z0WCB5_9GAMM|nr:TRAP transporter permease [Natronospirillum operosum]TGG92011.1 TRAP transporter fused permease subunit [Natronospirillum operosum]